MSVLIAFATVEGQTGKIARFAEEVVQGEGRAVRRVDLGGRPGPMDFAGVDRVILAGSVHERRHPKSFEVFLCANRAALAERRTMLLSVSLSAAFPEGIEDAEAYAEEMCSRTGLRPDARMLVPGAVRNSRYDFYARQIVRFVVLRDRGFDPGVGEWEFTDWDALGDGLRRFLREDALVG
ncbi:flavodoxin domain-containing protein [Jannaschia sp. W003]|uniref:flavodoxin domain-containing protein n=1 Tax=Jannaschia sp. W003 TaxID=2867012 RepID=UPI0021A936D8|nr:flavodoxin domain-containing protein [Jannaschia sp. W003]UWQ22639.1 protoporphyrinogen oxidase [Jannaschia sp. W003]